LTDVSKVLAASIIKVMIVLMMEAASTSEMSVNFYQTTWRNNPEGSTSVLKEWPICIYNITFINIKFFPHYTA
jgi:hypothetical protein